MNCPNCKSKHYLKVPGARILSEFNVHIADKYNFRCLKCDFESETIRVDTEYGKLLKLPWYIRIFKI